MKDKYPTTYINPKYVRLINRNGIQETDLRFVNHYHLLIGDSGYIPSGHEVLDNEIDLKEVLDGEIENVLDSLESDNSQIFDIEEIVKEKIITSNYAKVTFNRDLTTIDYIEILECSKATGVVGNSKMDCERAE